MSLIILVKLVFRYDISRGHAAKHLGVVTSNARITAYFLFCLSLKMKIGQYLTEMTKSLHWCFF